MVRKLIEWALQNPLVVILLAVALSVVGLVSFWNVNVEAYPDPAPAIVEVFAQYPGASAEEVERQVTVPLEVTFAGMPGLKAIRSKSLYGLSDLKMSWNYGSRYTYEAGRQEVINRLATLSQPLPTGVTPMISPESPTGEIYRYVLKSPKDKAGHEIYTLNDLKALQDWVLEREFKTVPRIVDVCGWGGTIRRYEVQPDPDRLRRYGITLAQLQAAIQNSNSTVGGDYVNEGQVAMTIRSVGLFGGGIDPTIKVLGMKDPVAAASYLRYQEERRIRDLRKLVITSVNNQPIRVEDVVEGGRLVPGESSDKGVVVSHLSRMGRIGYWKADHERPSRSLLTLAQVGHDEPDVVESIVLMRKNEQTLPALLDVEEKVKELNDPATGRLLPGVKLEPYYDRSDLMAITTETVRENLILGMSLVSLILLVFLSNVRSALIVAINIPLALLVAFSALYLRGMSANLLSIGAVDFGIIVDSSVIMVENIYRHLSTGEYAELTLKEQILRATHEVERGLFFTTAIMVCAFLPLFTMQGPEGQIFGPMADTYALALGGALVLALTLAPVLCLLSFKNLQPTPDNWLVRWLKKGYLRNLQICLRFRWVTVGVMATLTIGTLMLLPFLGREFMPALEEGNIWIRGTAARNISLERHTELSRGARAIIATYPAVESIVNQLGRPDDATDTDGFYNSEYFVPLRPGEGLAQVGQSDRMEVVVPWPHASPDKRRTGLGHERGARSQTTWYYVEFLAEHPRQRVRGPLRNQRRQLDQNCGTRSGHVGDAGVEDPDDSAAGARHRERRHFQYPRAVAHGMARRSRQVRTLGCSDVGRQQPGLKRTGGSLPVEHGRRRTAIRHFRTLAQTAANERGGDPRHSGRHHQ